MTLKYLMGVFSSALIYSVCASSLNESRIEDIATAFERQFYRQEEYVAKKRSKEEIRRATEAESRKNSNLKSLLIKASISTTSSSTKSTPK